jgi:hypothetical protein
MAHSDYEMSRSQLPTKEAPHGLSAVEPEVPRWRKFRSRFRPSGANLFVAGVELWYAAQIFWFSRSFRWQAFGVVLLIYWILGAMWCARDR